MKGVLVFIFLCLPATSQLLANDRSSLIELAEDIKTSRSVIQKNTAAFLLVSKELGADQVKMERILKVIKQNAYIHEADLINSEILSNVFLGTEFNVISKQGEWYQIKMPEGMNGWIHRDDIQQLYDDDNENSTLKKSDANHIEVRLLAEGLFQQLVDDVVHTLSRISEFEQEYRASSSLQQQENGRLYTEILDEREKIILSKAYADHFYQKLAPVQTARAGVAGGGNHPIGFDGVMSVRFGSSAYESASTTSETTRNISLAGSMYINPQSRLTVNLRHNNDVIQTPFSSSDLNLAYHYTGNGGTRLRTSLNFQNYGDQNINQNNFKNLGAGLNIEHPLNPATRFTGDLQFNSKSFERSGGNDFNGTQFDTRIDYRGDITRVNAGIRGRFQSSDIGFLDYNRVIPNLQLTFRTVGGNISIYAEGEQLSYSSDAEVNNFNRGRFDLAFNSNGRQTQMSVINKQFPNNENFDNLKFRLSNQRNTSSAGSFGRSTVYIQYTRHTQEFTQFSNYLDLRFDKNSSTQTGYFDIGMTGRYWEESEMDHRIDAYSRFGFKFSGIQIGPIVGAQILINPDDFEFKRVGNSFRAGVDARGNFIISNATIYSSVRFQRSFVYSTSASGISDLDLGLLESGSIVTRNPTTLEIKTGVQVPLANRFDLQADLSYYNIDLDMKDPDGFMMAARSGLRFMAGVSYRFQNH